MGERPRCVDPEHARPRLLGEAQRPVEHPGRDQAADELGVPERELRPQVARRARADVPVRLGTRRGWPRRAAATNSIASTIFT